MASARTEKYNSPGNNPVIFNSTIEEDLIRRDFSVNAIAFELLSDNFIDVNQGYESIVKKQLELLNYKSISEDPTRIIRGARYASRLDFNLSSESLLHLQMCPVSPLTELEVQIGSRNKNQSTLRVFKIGD